eukprot:COSAG02_NODE_47015_length_344_cov_0.832653_1_plen_45_part_10
MRELPVANCERNAKLQALGLEATMLREQLAVPTTDDKMIAHMRRR